MAEMRVGQEIFVSFKGFWRVGQIIDYYCNIRSLFDC